MQKDERFWALVAWLQEDDSLDELSAIYEMENATIGEEEDILHITYRNGLVDMVRMEDGRIVEHVNASHAA